LWLPGCHFALLIGICANHNSKIAGW
jgi:hypothetical protein